jgi:hypothetical protein
MARLFTSFYVFALAFGRASDRVNSRDSASNFIHALTLSLASTYVSVLALASALATERTLARARDQSTQLARWLAFASDHASDLARDHSSSRASALASALDLARASSLNLAGALGHVRNRPLARSRVLDLAQALASVSERARDLVHARDLIRAHTSTHAGNLVRDLTRASARARDLVGDLTHDLVSASDRDRASILAYDLVGISALVASDLVSSNTNAFVSALIQLPSTVDNLIDTQSRESQCNLDWHCNANPPVDSAEALIGIHHHEEARLSNHFDFLDWIAPLTFEAALGLVCRRIPIDASGQAIDRASARQAIRATALWVISELQVKRTHPSLVRQLLRISNNAQAELEWLLATYWKIYVDFAILEERIVGILPPCEGILLVRELVESDVPLVEARGKGSMPTSIS